MLKGYIKRIAVCIFGLVLFGFGTYLNIMANIGLSPWSSLNMGISKVTGILYGDVSVIVSIVLIGVDILLRENIGIGSILNAIIVGKIVDLLTYLNVVPMMNNYFFGIGVLLLGQLLLGVGSYFYMSTELGCGPRDSLMLALSRKTKKVPIGVVRCTIEAVVTLVGGLLGAKIGLGTLLSVVTIGMALQMVFKIFKYDPKSVKHENLLDTIRIFFNKNAEK